ncbi:hypothetical protein WJX81_002893 [Elliptochloris bilobata]|uniref:NAD-dependent epimerase/dehydratase domain-containing protein n=1 Tax=Elliptochloris bilobata TaxID=381761 RepID=A0AAW1QZY0_9CHLO
MLAKSGVGAHLFDPDDLRFLSAAALQELAASTHILSTIAPNADFDQDPVLLGHAGDLAGLVAAGSVRWAGYVSSTGVYGDWGGAWVDERSELRAAAGKGAARRRAEAAWLALHAEHDLPLHIFRLGGIYGPGRSALNAAAAQLGSERASQQRRARQRYTARCHVADVCAALAASMAAPCPGSIYNVADDDPASRAEHRTRARGALEEKRVSNTKLKRELGVRLIFPTYREGLAAIAAGDLAPFA